MSEFDTAKLAMQKIESGEVKFNPIVTGENGKSKFMICPHCGKITARLNVRYPEGIKGVGIFFCLDCFTAYDTSHLEAISLAWDVFNL